MVSRDWVSRVGDQVVLGRGNSMKKTETLKNTIFGTWRVAQGG